MDWWQERDDQKTRFVVFGLCSGALNAHRIAVADDRVVGLVALDGFAWPTPEFYLRHYGPRAISPARWLNAAQRRLLGQPQRQIADARTAIFNEDLPELSDVRREMGALASRGVEMLYVFSGGVEEYCNYRTQLADNLRGVDMHDRLELVFFRDADHTYTLMAHRERLFDCISRWLPKALD
jgi:hypothetical protein